MSNNRNGRSGFTLLEIIIVVAIIALLVAIVLTSLGESRKKARDGNRYAQMQEFLKGAELFYVDNKRYPNDGSATNVAITSVGEFEKANGGFFTAIPTDPSFPNDNGYFYCTSADGQNMAIFVHREAGAGGYCWVSRGPVSYTSYCGAQVNSNPAVAFGSGLDRCGR